MAYSPEFRDYLEDVLSPLGPVRAKRMFSGFGIFYRDVMFALCIDDVIYLKVDESNQARFAEFDASPFSYSTKTGRRSLKSYFQIPDHALDDETELLEWARGSVDAAKPKKKPRRGTGSVA